MRVIIIGSGIAGLAAAVGLRRVGIEAAVYERAPQLREVGAGISLWANALKALDHLGTGDAIRALAMPLSRSEFRSNDGRKVRMAFSPGHFEQKLGVSPFVAMIHRADLVGALAGFLPTGAARYGFE